MTERLNSTEGKSMAPATDNTSDAVAKSSNALDFSPTAKASVAAQPDAAGLISFAPGPNPADGPIIIDEEELARDFSSAFHVAAGKRDSKEFPIPDLYKDSEGKDGK